MIFLIVTTLSFCQSSYPERQGAAKCVVENETGYISRTAVTSMSSFKFIKCTEREQWDVTNCKGDVISGCVIKTDDNTFRIAEQCNKLKTISL